MRSTRNSQVGEFYVLQPPQVPPEAGREKFTCDILVYDEESDRHVRITWGQALDACCIGNGIADNTVMSHPTDGMGGNTLAEWLVAAEAIRDFNEGGGTAYAAIDTSIRIVVARPFIECARPLMNLARPRLPTTLTSPPIVVQAPDALGDHDQERPRDGRHAVRIPRPRTAAARARRSRPPLAYRFGPADMQLSAKCALEVESLLPSPW